MAMSYNKLCNSCPVCYTLLPDTEMTCLRCEIYILLEEYDTYYGRMCTEDIEDMYTPNEDEYEYMYWAELHRYLDDGLLDSPDYFDYYGHFEIPSDVPTGTAESIIEAATS